MQDMANLMAEQRAKKWSYRGKTNLDIVLKLQKYLEESGSTVILTRSDENGIYDLDKQTLKR